MSNQFYEKKSLFILKSVSPAIAEREWFHSKASIFKFGHSHLVFTIYGHPDIMVTFGTRMQS